MASVLDYVVNNNMIIETRGGSRTAATSKIEHFVIIAKAGSR